MIRILVDKSRGSHASGVTEAFLRLMPSTQLPMLADEVVYVVKKRAPSDLEMHEIHYDPDTRTLTCANEEALDAWDTKKLNRMRELLGGSR